MSKEAIIEQIGLKAQAKADEIKNAATLAAKAKLNKVKEQLSAEYEQKLASLSLEAEQNVQRQAMLIGLDAKKAELKVKREVIDAVYDRVKTAISSLEVNEYRSFVSGLISKYAENGDRVIICRDDVIRLTGDWLDDLAFDLQLDLKFADEYHDDVGGVILRGAKYDKNLTISAIIGDVRAKTEGEIAKRLFAK